MNYLKKISPYSFREKLQLLKYTLGSILINSVKKGLKNSYHLTCDLLSDNIQLKKYDENIQFNFSINDSEKKFQLKRNSSDPLVFRQIIFEEEYRPIITISKKANIPIHTLVDAGANIGLTSIYFKSFFPDVKIIALEPSKECFSRLKANVELNNFDKITLLNKGLWSSKTTLRPDHSFRDGQDWSFRLVEAKNGETALFETTSIPDLLNEYALASIDFLKIDIEGSEVQLFDPKTDTSWLQKVRIIAIEIHDEFNCREHIEQVLTERGFELSYSGELTIGVTKNRG